MAERKKTATGGGGRIVAARLLPEANIVLGIKEICRENDIKNGVILSCIGSLRKASFLLPTTLPHKKAGFGYGEPIVLEGVIEILSLTGMVCHDNDELLLHIHYTIATKDGGFGGHLTEDNNIVLQTTDILIQEVTDVDMIRKYDEETDIPMFSPQTILLEQDGTGTGSL